MEFVNVFESITFKNDFLFNILKAAGKKKWKIFLIKN